MGEAGSMLAEIIAVDYFGDEKIISDKIERADKLVQELQEFYKSPTAQRLGHNSKPLYIDMDLPVEFLEYCLTIEPTYPLY